MILPHRPVMLQLHLWSFRCSAGGFSWFKWLWSHDCLEDLLICCPSFGMLEKKGSLSPFGGKEDRMCWDV